MTAKRISVEVGHGGADPGAVCGNVREKDINLTVALELKRQLERHGAEVLISRLEDVNDKAADFFPKAKAFCPDIGISVHANAFDGKAAGFEIFRSAGNFKTLSDSLCKRIESEVKALGQVSRGVKDSGFLMSSLPCPTAYCELGFLDSPEDYKKFDTPEKLRAFGKAYAKGILGYLGIDFIEETTVAETAKSRALYRVIAGSFSDKNNAEALAKSLKAKGVDCFIAKL